MRIKFVEVQNFRKLKSIRIDFSETITLLVGQQQWQDVRNGCHGPFFRRPK